MTEVVEPTEATGELLVLRDLHVAYRTSEGRLPAVRGVDLVVHEGEVVGVAGESGCGKSTLVSTVLRLQPKNARVEGEVEVLGHDVRTMRWGDLRALRWAGASIVFQGALHSLNPVHRVGRQIAEPIRGPRAGAVQGGGRPPGRRAARAGRPEHGAGPELPAPALRRPAAAGDDRDGPRVPAEADRGRRADHRARRDGAGPDPRPARRPGPRPRRRADDHQPRPVRARRRLRPGAGDVRRPGRRDRRAPPRCSPTRCTPTRPRSPGPSRGSVTRRRATPRPGSPATRRTRGSCPRAARSRRAARGPWTAARRPSRRWSRSHPVGRWPASGWVSRDRPRRHHSAPARGPRRHRRVRDPDRSRRARSRRRRPEGAPRRGAGHRRRVRIGQDHAGPHADGAGAADSRRGAVRGHAAGLLVPGHEGLPQPGADGPAGCRRARSTPGRPSTSRWPRAFACTGGPTPTRRAAPRRSWSRPRSRRPGCGRRNDCSCAIRTSCPAARSSES